VSPLYFIVNVMHRYLKTVLGILLLSSLFFGLGTVPVAAQEEEVLYATGITIFNTEISLSLKEADVFSVSFDVINGIGFKEKIKYAIQLTKTGDETQSVVDTHIYNEELSLGNNEKLHRDITYRAPLFLKGEYDVWLWNKNSKGTPLSLAHVGTVMLNGSGEYVEIEPPSCFLTVEGEEERFSPLLMVEIESGESLLGHCRVTNHFNTPVTFTPSFSLFHQSLFGDQVASPLPQNQSQTLGAGESYDFSFTLPSVEKVGSYEVSLTLKDESGVDVSNGVVFKYRLLADSGTMISNFILSLFMLGVVIVLFRIKKRVSA